MKPLSDEERRAFLDIYDHSDEIEPVAEPVIESLIRRGLLVRTADDALELTTLGNELYESMRPDEPYEGV
jgi:predicted methyltransferase